MYEMLCCECRPLPFLFQAVQNRQYNDHAAMYYLLLSKWEKGELHIPLAKTHAAPHPRLSLTGVAPSLPQISIQKTNMFAASTSNGPVLATQERVTSDIVQKGESNVEGAEEVVEDSNLDRYLKQGRRHTLGAAHNTMMATDMKKY